MTGKVATEFELNGGKYTIFDLDFFINATPTKTHALKIYNKPSVYMDFYKTSIFLFDTNLDLAGTSWAHKTGLKLNEKGFYEVVEQVAGSGTSSNDLSRFDMVLLAHDGFPDGNAWIKGLQVGDIITITGINSATVEPGEVEGTINVYSAGTGDLSGQVILAENTTLPIPSKADHVFGGWYASADFSGDPTTVAPNGKIYAKWVAPERSITYNLNEGYFGYPTREAMVADFMKDFNAAFSLNLEASGFQAGTYQKNVFTIFTHETYGAKWVWMREYIISVAKAQGHASASSLESNNDAYWRAAIDAFLNKNQFASWPY